MRTSSEKHNHIVRHNRNARASVTIILQSARLSFGDVVPVDIELMFEELKWIDPRVYRMFCRLKYRGMTGEQLRNEKETFSNVRYALNGAVYLNDLEASGHIDIYNDYENERVVVRRIREYEPDGGEV